MKKEWWILLGIGVLGLVYLMRRAKPQPQENTINDNLEMMISNFESRIKTPPTPQVKRTPQVKSNDITIRRAVKNYQLSHAIIKAYTDPEIAKILPTQPTELKRVLYPLFEEKRPGGGYVPRDIRIPY